MKDGESSPSLTSAEDEKSKSPSPSDEPADSDSHSSKSNRTRMKRRRCRDAADDELSNIAADGVLAAAVASIAVDPDKEDSDMHPDEEDSDLFGAVKTISQNENYFVMNDPEGPQ